MHRLLILSAFLLATTASAQTPTVALGAVHVYEAYSDHPLVVAVRSQGYLAILDREKALDKRFPADRAWAAIDAVGADGVARHAVDQFVTQGLQARLAIGASGAIKSRDIDVAQMDARQAFALGWLRALAAGDDVKRLARRSTKLADAGALQLLEHAEKLAPGVQAVHVAYELIAAAADPEARNACMHATQIAKAVREGGGESLRLAAAERVDAIAKNLGASCTRGEMAAFSVPIQLPPPLQEVQIGQRAGVKALVTLAPAPPSVPFVVTAPVFKAWLRDPLVASVAGGAPLVDTGLQDAMQRDPTGDLAVAVLNAAALVGRQSADTLAEVAWVTVAKRHAPTSPDGLRLSLGDLSALEAMVYGYAVSLKPQTDPDFVDLGNARLLSSARLFAAANGRLPSAAVLGPIMALGFAVDLARGKDHCRPVDQMDALRGVVLRANLPEAARQPLVQALDTLLGQCPTAPAQRPKP